VGYVESAAMGLLAGRFAAAERRGAPASPPPEVSALGALLIHVTGGHLSDGNSFQPMNVNFGLFPPIDIPPVRGKERTRERRLALARRALDAVDRWLAEDSAAIAAE
jgi:methylenetetrahydrofolate--tRNA-(uracil-5-)-methyltransferase